MRHFLTLPRRIRGPRGVRQRCGAAGPNPNSTMNKSKHNACNPESTSRTKTKAVLQSQALTPKPSATGGIGDLTRFIGDGRPTLDASEKQVSAGIEAHLRDAALSRV